MLNRRLPASRQEQEQRPPLILSLFHLARSDRIRSASLCAAFLTMHLKFFPLYRSLSLSLGNHGPDSLARFPSL